MDYDVIIIGAGASGLMAAVSAARQGSSVLVLEQKDKAGKKILATGNGRCNFTNSHQTPECYRSDDSSFAWKVLSYFDYMNTLRFFEELGIYPKEREGYYYPYSEQAASILNVLLMECDRLKVRIHCNETVIGIRNPDYTVVTRTTAGATKETGNKPNDINKIKSNNKTVHSGTDKYNHIGDPSEAALKAYSAKKLILATGGCASPKLGSDGSGYDLAKHFGHSLIKPLPALVQLKSPDKYCRTVSGVRLNAKVSSYSGDTLLAEETGEVLFTDYGISGIPIMQISRYAAGALDRNEKVDLRLDFLPELTKEELKGLLKKRIGQNPAKSAEEMLVGLFNHKLNYIIIKEAGLDPYKISGSVTDQEIYKLVNHIKAFIMRINAANSFENAQVTAGGVSTKEVNERTMESRLSKGLYLTGELLDVDGTCGGYNLQWAWSTGYLAGTAAGRKHTL